MTDDAKTPDPEGSPTAHTVPSTSTAPLPKEIGGTEGPEPTRYGDWAHKGRVTDF
jgi:hypothetical protein